MRQFGKFRVPLQPKTKLISSMRKIFLACWVMLVAVFMLPSCLGSDDDVEVYDDVAITSFSLGTLNRYVTATIDGKDTTYKVSYAGSAYKMAIDQLGCRIFNNDSLPVGTDVKHVVCSLSVRNNALITIKSMTSDSLTVFSTTDSIDFSQPRTFRIFSTDGQHYRDYVVSVSARQVEAGTLLWTAVEEGLMPETELVADSIDVSNIDADASLVPTQSLSYVAWTGANNIHYVMWAGLLNESDEAMTLWRKVSDAGHAGQWVYMTLDESNPYYLPAMKQVVMVYYGGTLLAIGGNGTIYQSRDQGITWNTSSKLAMPAGYTGGTLKAVVQDGWLWLQAGNKCWKGTMTK